MVVNANAYVLFGVDFRSNEKQRELIRLINEEPETKPVVYCVGAAGTGKTFTALAASLALVRSKGTKSRYKNIFYVREPVEIGHRLGYLKGTEEDKFGPHLGGLLDNYNHLMAYAKEAGLISPKEPRKAKTEDGDASLPKAYQRLPSDIIPLAPEFIRGRSFENCIILADEAQNLTLDEIQTLTTRIGKATKLVLLGSPNQIDVPTETIYKNAFLTSYEILKDTGLVGYVELESPMRSSFVREFDERFVKYKMGIKK